MSGDEHQMLLLYEQVSGVKMTLDFWKWKYERAPFGKSIIRLMFDGDALIGHVSAIPIDLQVRTTTLRAAFGLDLMIHPDYKGQGLYIPLIAGAEDQCRRNRLQLEYGFPNGRSYLLMTRRFGWKDIARISILYKKLQGESSGLLLSKGAYEICQIEEFGDDVDLLWYKAKGEYNTIVPRTKEFLNWRYVERPGVNYTKYVSRESNGQLTGYIILKIFSDGTKMRGHIIDIFSLNDKEIMRGLIKRSLDYFVENGIKNISCWMQDNYHYDDVLKEEGFVGKETTDCNYFGVKVIHQVIPSIRTVEKAENWYFTMGDDLDVF
jgi:GNAT superfamily N-acetyltransferase